MEAMRHDNMMMQLEDSTSCTPKLTQESVVNKVTAASLGPTKVSPKEWHGHHDDWLNTIMRAAISDPNHPDLP